MIKYLLWCWSGKWKNQVLAAPTSTFSMVQSHVPLPHLGKVGVEKINLTASALKRELVTDLYHREGKKQDHRLAKRKYECE